MNSVLVLFLDKNFVHVVKHILFENNIKTLINEIVLQRSMESVSVKFQENVVKKIDEAILRKNFNSRTEFIREAVRDKLEEMNKDELISRFLQLKGKAKTKVSDEQLKKNREKVSEELVNELKKRFR